MIHLDDPETEEQRIDRRIKSIGRGLAPTYKPGRQYKKDVLSSWKERAKSNAERIAAKYEKPTGKKLVRVVDSNLRVHSTIIVE